MPLLKSLSIHFGAIILLSILIIVSNKIINLDINLLSPLFKYVIRVVLIIGLLSLFFMSPFFDDSMFHPTINDVLHEVIFIIMFNLLVFSIFFMDPEDLLGYIYIGSMPFKVKSMISLIFLLLIPISSIIRILKSIKNYEYWDNYCKSVMNGTNNKDDRCIEGIQYYKQSKYTSGYTSINILSIIYVISYFIFSYLELSNNMLLKEGNFLFLLIPITWYILMRKIKVVSV